jgi:chloramphenicol-sensitive protein RarD
LGLGVFLYGEPFTAVHRVTFAFIWTALLIYSFNALMNGGRVREVQRNAPPES